MNEMVEIFFGAMVVGFSGALVPGPMLTLVISSVAEKGFWTSFFIVVGHVILELVVVAAFFLGLLRYLENPLVAGKRFSQRATLGLKRDFASF